MSVCSGGRLHPSSSHIRPYLCIYMSRLHGMYIKPLQAVFSLLVSDHVHTHARTHAHTPFCLVGVSWTNQCVDLCYLVLWTQPLFSRPVGTLVNSCSCIYHLISLRYCPIRVRWQARWALGPHIEGITCVRGPLFIFPIAINISCVVQHTTFSAHIRLPWHLLST